MKTMLLAVLFMVTVLANAQVENIKVTCICSPDQATGAIEIEPGPDLEDASWWWTGPGGFTAPFQSIYGLEDTGVYHLVASMPSGESVELSQWVGYCMGIESAVQGGIGGAGFTISVEVDGDGPFEYAWSVFDGQQFASLGVFQPLIGGLPPGYYALEIRQVGNQCRIFESFTLADNGAFLLSTCLPTAAGNGSRSVRLMKSLGGNGEWLVREASGQVTWREQLPLQAGSQVVTISVPPHLDPGVYTLEIRQGATTLLASPVLR